MFVFFQALAMLLLLAVTAASVIHHESYGASEGRSEHWLGRYGHLDYVIVEDVAAASLLVLVAGITWLLARSPKRNSPSCMQVVGRYVAALLLIVVAGLMTVETLGELSILGSEDQRLLDAWGHLTRVIAYSGTLVLACWSLLLAMWLLFFQPKPKLHGD